MPSPSNVVPSLSNIVSSPSKTVPSPESPSDRASDHSDADHLEISEGDPDTVEQALTTALEAVPPLLNTTYTNKNAKSEKD